LAFLSIKKPLEDSASGFAIDMSASLRRRPILQPQVSRCANTRHRFIDKPDFMSLLGDFIAKLSANLGHFGRLTLSPKRLADDDDFSLLLLANLADQCRISPQSPARRNRSAW